MTCLGTMQARKFVLLAIAFIHLLFRFNFYYDGIPKASFIPDDATSNARNVGFLKVWQFLNIGNCVFILSLAFIINRHNFIEIKSITPYQKQPIKRSADLTTK